MDLIDREKLKEAIKMAITVPVDCSYDLGYNDMVLNAVKIADSMPTIDAQPVKHGHWIECDSQPNQKMCSSCRGVGVAKDIAQFFTYCPFCGADMRGDKNGR